VSRALLFLNLAILVANFAVAWGVSESSNASLRTTGRILGDVPCPPPARSARAGAEPPVPWTKPVPGGAGRPERAPAVVDGPGDGLGRLSPVVVRLTRFLGRMESADRLTADQMATLYREVVRCASELRAAAVRWNGRVPDGARARAEFDALRRRLGRETGRALHDVLLREEELRERLVRAVLASAG